MTSHSFMSWPSPEALAWEDMTRPRRIFSRAIRILLCGVLVWGIFTHRELPWWGYGVVALAILVSGALAYGYWRATVANRLLPALTCLAALLVLAQVAHAASFRTAALVLWGAAAVAALERMPVMAALPVMAVGLGAYAVVNQDSWLTTAVTTGGLALAGCVLRLDAEARGTAQRLLTQERAARKAEAESAALAERARIAREIHDVLAHSLSAQLVHLEAARLLIERSGDLEQIRERVVAARGMARDGLAETRQALSALRGEISPVEDFLEELVAVTSGAAVTVEGERRQVSAEASQAVRRVAQEALTNVRKHAPGAKVAMRLEYAGDELVLDVRDTGGSPGELAVSGAGYGLRGMRERAELLGGTLEAGPYEEGFAVTLKVPV
ncbi:sensor histidine kinase [Streptomyces sp. NPDC058045]|uniref:sensor histidine kinase n=1 Tax=Streptomyces sp. NPDC058045 TaxID=3346311 RepID=UPI0036E9FDC3